MNARIVKKMVAEQLSLSQHNFEVLLEIYNGTSKNYRTCVKI
jgi:hypothetical protein